jgi:hypothetical protein
MRACIGVPSISIIRRNRVGLQHIDIASKLSDIIFDVYSDFGFFHSTQAVRSAITTATLAQELLNFTQNFTHCVSRVLSILDLAQLGPIMSPDPGAIFAYLKRRQHATRAGALGDGEPRPTVRSGPLRRR